MRAADAALTLAEVREAAWMTCFAPRSVARRLGTLGANRGALEMRTLEDALELRRALATRPRMVIVGCGFVGVEAASAALAARSERDSSAATLYGPFPSFCRTISGRACSLVVCLIADRAEVVEGSLAERRVVAAAYRGEELVGATTYAMARAHCRTESSSFEAPAVRVNA